MNAVQGAPCSTSPEIVGLCIVTINHEGVASPWFAQFVALLTLPVLIE